MDTKINSLPPINQLFKDSWATFTQSILPLFILNILGIVIYISLGIVAFLIFVLSGAGSFLLKNGLQNIAASFSSIPPSSIITASVLTVITTVVLIIVGSMLQIASILIIDKEGKIPLGESFRKSLGFIIPLFLVGILTFILSFGALFVFILPVVLFSFLLAFVQLEVILNNQRGLSAIKKSVTVVSKHFGAILIRFILLFLIYLGISFIGNLFSKAGSETATLVGILSFLVNILLGWFSLAYSITLYKQASAGMEHESGKGIGWMWIISILGWLIAIGLGFVTYKTISSGILNDLLKNNTSPGTSIQRSVNEMSPQAKAQYELSSQLFKQMRNIQTDKDMNETQIVTETKKINDQNIAALKKALETDPNNPKIWFELGNAYTWISSTGKSDDSFNAYQKAAELDPKNTIYIDYVAEMLIQTKQYEKAILELQKSLRIGQESGDESGLTHYRLGLAYAGLKIYDSAREHLQKSIEILSKNNKNGAFDDNILKAQKDLSNLPK